MKSSPARLIAFAILSMLMPLSSHAQSMTVTNSLRLWLKADTAVTTNSSGLVQTWGDQSGNALNASQSISTNRPTIKLNQINGKPTVRFDGTSDYLVTPSHVWTNSNFTIVTVTKKWGNAKGYHHLISRMQDIGTNGSKYFQLISSNGTQGATVFLNKTDARANTSLVLDTNQYHIITVTRQNKKTKGTKIYIDSALSAESSTLSTTNDLTSSANYSFFIGGWKTARAKSHIAELLVYEKVLSTNDIASVEGYLKAKYNLGSAPPPPPSGAKGYMGDAYSVFLKSDGTLTFTGRDVEGQRGDGSTVHSTTSVVAVPQLNNITEIAADYDHLAALTSSGNVYCWGYNTSYQSNSNTVGTVDAPALVTNLTSVAHVSAGWAHTISCKTDGTVWSWGDCFLGQIGDNTYGDINNQRRSPTQAFSLTGVVDVEAGAYSSYALKSDGTLWAWGDRSFGQLGDGSSNAGGVKAPKQVATGVSNMTSFAYHVMIMKTDGTVWATGYNDYGQIGDGTTTQRNSFVQIPGLSNVKQLAAGLACSYALKNDGTVWSWGDNSVFAPGALGLGNNVDHHTPTQIPTLSSIVHIEAGTYGATATKSDGTVYTWGGNADGQLGDGSTTTRTSPVVISVP